MNSLEFIVFPPLFFYSFTLFGAHLFFSLIPPDCIQPALPPIVNYPIRLWSRNRRLLRPRRVRLIPAGTPQGGPSGVGRTIPMIDSVVRALRLDSAGTPTRGVRAFEARQVIENDLTWLWGPIPQSQKTEGNMSYLVKCI